MPQMAPMLWLMLFFYFTMIFLMFIIISYYTSHTVSNKTSLISGRQLSEHIWSW